MPTAQLPRVSSLVQLTLLALAVVLVPPAIAVGSAVVEVGHLARSSEAAALTAGETVGLARDLVDSTTAMERHARQRAILADDVFLVPYEARRADFVRTAEALATRALPTDLHASVEALSREEAALHQALVARPAGDPASEAALDGLGGLTADAREVLAASDDTIAATARRLHEDAVALEGRLVRRAALALPLLLVLLALVVVAIVRPLRNLDRAVRQIGAGELDTAIQVRGPSDLRALGERLEWLRQRLLALEGDRIRLFRHLSHELKTPLASLTEGSQLLADEVVGTLAPEQREIVAILRDNTGQLQQRIEDLLRLGELRTQAVSPVFHEVDLAALVREVLTRHQVAARARGLAVDAELEPVHLLGDAPRLSTVVDNLVGNAVKFSPSGSLLTMRLVRDGPVARLDVEDQGPGVDADERERIFEAFYQGRASREGHVRGTGIGLTLAREYARMHGGDLVVTQERAGALFRLNLPIQGT